MGQLQILPIKSICVKKMRQKLPGITASLALTNMKAGKVIAYLETIDHPRIKTIRQLKFSSPLNFKGM
jgi:hypothetical protein